MKLHVRPSKSMSVLTIIGIVAMMAFVFTADFGGFGILFLIVAGGMLWFHARNLLGDKGVATEVIELTDSDHE